ncbi:hypothetical protein [Vallitalea guaymasensis]|uniref:hypothetical protein n=1 Tax=Vallitalea guaymasensis TaxID=1185412 RepID=UPI000DE36857|nr:hypothetical protein [Vallitalea guaymasensis]
MYIYENNSTNNSYQGCRVITVDDIESNEDNLLNTWVIIKLLNNSFYQMYITEINDYGVGGTLYLGSVPDDTPPSYSLSIKADIFFLYDYIENMILENSY